MDLFTELLDVVGDRRVGTRRLVSASLEVLLGFCPGLLLSYAKFKALEGFPDHCTVLFKALRARSR